MPPFRLAHLVAVATVSSAFVFPNGATAQQWTLPRVMPGGADKAFDIIGIAPGMTCDDALARVQSQSQTRARPGGRR